MAAAAAPRRSGLLYRIRVFLRPPRRLRLRRPGGFLVVGTFVLGIATLNTGNNLLYLLLGALLGTIALSGWLSEQALRGIRVQRRLPRAVHAGDATRIEYQVHNRKERLPSHGLVLREMRQPLDDFSTRPRQGDAPLPIQAFAPVLEAGGTARVRADLEPRRRGVFPLHGVTLVTAFPFGLFEKERDLELPGTLVVWPRTDRRVRPPRAGGRSGARIRAGSGAAQGAERGDYRGLREYRPGDDPRDIHWRSTARRGQPILRQYDRQVTNEYWIVLDLVAPAEESGEAAVEVAASLLASAHARGDRAGLVAGDARIMPHTGGGGLDAALDALAAVTLSPAGPLPDPAVDRGSCVLVTARGGGGEWGDVIVVEGDPA
jgi:uncharacterized protein (DUF58 family)